MTDLADVLLLPPWADDPAISRHYFSALRRLVNEFSQSAPTAQLLLENWHALARLHPRTATGSDPFQDFWPWYAEIAE